MQLTDNSENWLLFYSIDVQAIDILSTLTQEKQHENNNYDNIVNV